MTTFKLTSHINKSSDAPAGPGYLPECESIRGIAILLVFCFHYLGSLSTYNSKPDIPFGMGLLYGGNTGVTLFFLLSGFLLTRPFIAGVPRHFGIFLARRALRILPMYYLAVLIGALINNQWLVALKSMFFYGIELNTLWPMGGVWWSLVVEIQFYLLLPLLVWLADRPRWRWLLLPLLIAAVLTYLRIRSAGPQEFGSMRGNLMGRWPVFLLGAALAWNQIRHGETLKLLVTRTPWLGTTLLITSVCALVLLCDYRVRNFGWLAHVFFFDYYLFDGIAWAAFMFALLNFKPLGRRLLVNSFMDRLGAWSYSIYLLHTAVIFYIAKKWHIYTPSDIMSTITFGAALLLICVGLASITYTYVEQPFLRIKLVNRPFSVKER